MNEQLANDQKVASRTGWILVPIEPTTEMICAGEDTFIPCYTGTPVSEPGTVWTAMIKASPFFMVPEEE